MSGDQIGPAMKVWRTFRDWSQERTAGILHISRQTLAEYERGRVPRQDVRERMAQYLREGGMLDQNGQPVTSGEWRCPRCGFPAILSPHPYAAGETSRTMTCTRGCVPYTHYLTNWPKRPDPKHQADRCT